MNEKSNPFSSCIVSSNSFVYSLETSNAMETSDSLTATLRLDYHSVSITICQLQAAMYKKYPHRRWLLSVFVFKPIT
jgi:hypothetical protein